MDNIKKVPGFFTGLTRPCYGFHLGDGIKLLALIDIGLQLMSAFVFVISITFVMGPELSMIKLFNPSLFYARVIYWAFYFMHQGISIWLDVAVYRATFQKDVWKLKIFSIVSTILTSLWVGVVISHVVWLKGLTVMAIVGMGIIFFLKVYTIGTVCHLIREIKEGTSPIVKRYPEDIECVIS